MTTSKRTTLLLGAIAMIVTLVIATSPALDATDERPTFGPIPEDAWGQGNELDETKVPTFITVVDNTTGEIVGYAAAALVALPSAGDHEGPIPVTSLDKSGELVGHLWPDIGFVPTGPDPESLRQPPTTVVESP